MKLIDRQRWIRIRGISSLRRSRNGQCGAWVETAHRTVIPFRIRLLIFPAQAQIESQLSGGPPVVVQVNGVVRRADRLRCDLACATGARQSKQQRSQTLANTPGRTGRIVQGATSKGRIERKAAGRTVQAGDVLPVLGDV